MKFTEDVVIPKERLISVHCPSVLVGHDSDGWAIWEQGQEITYVVRRAPQ